MSRVAHFPCLLQTGSVEKYAVRDVERVLELVVGWLKEFRKFMEIKDVVEPVDEVVHANLLRNLLRLAELLDPDVEELVAHTAS